ncbi:MAG: hypothetical protein ACRDRK_21705 [Pseudonocardia sp.]
MSADVIRLTSPAFLVGTPADADDDTVLLTFEGATATVFVRLTGQEAADLSVEVACHRWGADR